jgi:hypothetical protein
MGRLNDPDRFEHPDAPGGASAALLGVVDAVLALELVDVELARTVVLGSNVLSARDAIHVAVMRRHRVDRILSFDVGFDAVPGLTRIS